MQEFDADRVRASGKAFQTIIQAVDSAVEKLSAHDYLETLEQLNGHIAGRIEAVQQEIEEES